MTILPASSTPPPTLRCRGLSHHFGKKAILAGLDFDLPRGSITVLLGPNGCGKSTTLKLLCGLIPTPRGTVWVEGRDVRKAASALKANLGVVPDGLALFEHLTLEEHLQLLGPVYGLSLAETEARSQELLATLDLASFRHLPLRLGSHGTRRRAALALALLHGPSLLLLDEPLEGLDPAAAETVARLLASLASRGTTVLMTGHGLFWLKQVAHRVLFLKDGRIQWEGPLAEIEGGLEAFFAEGEPRFRSGDLEWFAHLG